MWARRATESSKWSIIGAVDHLVTAIRVDVLRSAMGPPVRVHHALPRLRTLQATTNGAVWGVHRLKCSHVVPMVASGVLPVQGRFLASGEPVIDEEQVVGEAIDARAPSRTSLRFTNRRVCVFVPVGRRAPWAQ